MVKHYTTRQTRRQILIIWRDGQTRELRHYPRTERGRASAQRTIARLAAGGYTYCKPAAFDAAA